MSRFRLPMLVWIPFFSIWQTAGPMWTVGIWSILAGHKSEGQDVPGGCWLLNSGWLSAHPRCQISVYFRSFQSTVFCLWLFHLPDGEPDSSSPFSSRSVYLAVFGEPFPFSSIARNGEAGYGMGLPSPVGMAKSAISCLWKRNSGSSHEKVGILLFSGGSLGMARIEPPQAGSPIVFPSASAAFHRVVRLRTPAAH